MKNVNSDTLLTECMAFDVAAILGVCEIYTVGALIHAWSEKKNRPAISQAFDSTLDAENAVEMCVLMLQVKNAPVPSIMLGTPRWLVDSGPKQSASPQQVSRLSTAYAEEKRT